MENITLGDILEEINDTTYKYERKDLIQIIREGLEQDNLAQAVLDMYNSVEDTRLELDSNFKVVDTFEVKD